MHRRLLQTLRALLKLVVLALLGTVAIMLLAVLYVAISTRGAIYRSAALPPHDVVLVLGASIKSTGELSPVLKERADGALALYKAGVVQKILVSGDNATLQYNEVYPVGKYLLREGVPQHDIFLDYAGFDTYSSMYRAKYIFGVRSMVVASQRFHLPRALFIAERMGIDVVGFDVSQQSDDYSQNALREVPATIKALADLSMRRMPHYLGPTFFVSGDGSATWVGSTSQMIYFKDE
ncbi:MAG: SanA protein [Patescibacteria group bacterium]|nr:SanA protein [Patescibacteria group bacterium]